MHGQWIHLHTQGCLHLTGADALPWLQALVTQDILDLNIGEVRYTLLLTPQGRCRGDFFIHNTPDGLLLATNKETLQIIAQHLQMYCLNKDVHLQDASDAYHTWACFPCDISIPAKPLEEIAPDLRPWGDVDPRFAPLGWRFLLPATHMPYDTPETQGTQDTYTALRFRYGIAESTEWESGHTLPFDFALHHLGALSTTKGCYLGQELIARALHRGTIRRHIFPGTFLQHADNNIAFKPPTDVLHEERKVGHLLAQHGPHVLVRMPVADALSYIAKETPLHADTQALRLHKPPWLP